jgi:hypothetical protein
MHLDPVGLRRRALAHTVLPSIVTQLIHYYPPPEVFYSGSGHNNVIRLLVNVEKFNQDMSTVLTSPGGKIGKKSKSKVGQEPAATASTSALVTPSEGESEKKKKKRKAGEEEVSAAAAEIPKLQKFDKSNTGISGSKNPRNSRSPGKIQTTLGPPVP